MVEVTHGDEMLAFAIVMHLNAPRAQEDYIARQIATHREAAAKAGRDAGIIEGLEMADQKLKVLMLGLPMNGPKAQALLAASAAIHALIGEKI